MVAADSANNVRMRLRAGTFGSSMWSPTSAATEWRRCYDRPPVRSTSFFEDRWPPAASLVAEAIPAQSRQPRDQPHQEPGPPPGVMGVIFADQGFAHHPRTDETERFGGQDPLAPTDGREAGDRVVWLVDQGGQDPASQPARSHAVAREAVGLLHAPPHPSTH